MDAQNSYLSSRPRRRGPSTGAVVFLAIIFGVIAGFGGALGALWAWQHDFIKGLPFNQSTASAMPQVTTSRPTGAFSHSSSFADVADAMDESVVNINTLSRQQNPYAWFFGQGQQVVKGLGTGVIVDKKGYILTNFHVVGDAQDITVTVMHRGGQKQYKASLIQGDKREDLAVIKISAPNLKPVKFGNSDALRPGDPVMAIGNPFGFEHTVSVGVVSALNRDLPVEQAVTLKSMIQTDASINPGNSGGPLVNLNGEVVGINSAIYVGSGSGQPQAHGLGFAIPSNHAVKIMELLRNKSKVQHPYVGIKYEAINEQVRSEQHLPVSQGMIVMAVIPKGPADHAGLKQGDIIIAVDGKTLDDANKLGDIIAQKSVGKTLDFAVKQWNGSSWVDKHLKVKAADMPNDIAQGEAQPQPRPQPSEGDNNSPFPFPLGP